VSSTPPASLDEIEILDVIEIMDEIEILERAVRAHIFNKSLES